MNWPAARRALFGGRISQIRLSGLTFVAGSPEDTVIGTLSLTGAAGTPTWGLVSTLGGKVKIVGNQLRVGATPSVVGDSPLSVTITVTGVTPVVGNKTFTITVSAASLTAGQAIGLLLSLTKAA